VKYAIKLNKGYWYDGANAISVYDTAGWLGGKSLEVFRPTVYDTKEQAQAVVRTWFNNNDHFDFVEQDGKPAKRKRYCTIGGRAVGQYLLEQGGKSGTKSILVLNDGELPEVIEVVDDFGRPGWLVTSPDEAAGA
jgi:hypothetical protein